MAVPPDLVGFAEAAGLEAAGFGPNSRSILDAHRDFLVLVSQLPTASPGGSGSGSTRAS